MSAFSLGSACCFKKTNTVLLPWRGKSNPGLQGYDQSPVSSRWNSTKEWKWQRDGEETGPRLPAVRQRLGQRRPAEWGASGHPDQQRRSAVLFSSIPLQQWCVFLFGWSWGSLELFLLFYSQALWCVLSGKRRMALKCSLVWTTWDIFSSPAVSWICWRNLLRVVLSSSRASHTREVKRFYYRSLFF